MIARRAATFAMTVALIVAIAVPATAKGAYTVTLIGGGQQTTFTGDGEPHTNTILSNFAESVVIYDGMWSEGTRIDRPAGDLGPSITAVWLFIGPARDIPITQHLYPFAAGGPVAHIPRQMFINEAVDDAWFPMHDDVVNALASVGFDIKAFNPDAVVEAVAPPTTVPLTTVPPTTVPVTTAPAASPAVDPSAPDTDSRFPWLIAIGLIAGTGTVLSAIMGRRHIRRVA